MQQRSSYLKRHCTQVRNHRYSLSSLSSAQLSTGVMKILEPSGFRSNFVIAFILLLKKPTLAPGQFSVIGPAGPIQAPLGGEAELICYLSPPQSAQHMEVVWLQSTRVVHLYQDGEDQFGDQAAAYQGRTELVRDAITKGNVTLKIRDVRLLDAGRYKCLIEDGFHQEEADVELKVLGEEIVSKIFPPIYFLFIMMVCVVIYLIFLSLMLLFQVHFRRSKPWMGKISGILVLICAFEIEVCIFYFWMRHRCRGFLFDETSLRKEYKFALPFILLVITKIIPVTLQTKYFFPQMPCCRTQ
ncbi:myelin-oligodendrocyte glycoprotein-like isoform X2 [Petaurus breviceps papuanus]|uniref:myelin-oligodendrocyte glycoprotein-like isoform X2 n=1 Tax=Petaurus breviceps papuanus TaxID=3040969 RepID=UPI0036DAB3BE